MNIKKLIAESVKLKIEGVDFENLIIESTSSEKGDYSLPCFSLAKILKENPMAIANKIAESVICDSIVEKCEVVNGYVNFFLNKEAFSKEILKDFSDTVFNSKEGEGEVVCIDYCSPNLAKYLHIGHLKTLIIGESLARLFELFGYTVKRLNFIGDYGTPFGKIIGGLLRWGSIEEVEKRGNDALQEYYVKFNKAEETDETLTQEARDIFKKIVDKDEKIYPIYEKIIKIALEDANKMFKLLGVEFDDFRGEEYYESFAKQTIELLSKKGMIKDSQGAKIVEFDDDMPPAVIIKSDGTTLYLTRDISAAIKRYEDYKFDKMIYVTDVAQVLHFNQLFKVMELAGFDYAKNMEHVPYGRFSLPDGKISSRRGKQAVLVDLMEYTQNKAHEVVKDRTFEIEDGATVEKTVASAVLNYNVLKVERIKDCVFDIEKAFSFEGETAPYMQYTYTRLESILRKNNIDEDVADYSCIDSGLFEIVKMINDFDVTLKIALEKRDVSIVAKRVMDLCKTFNKVYATTKILDGNAKTTKAKINLVKALRDTLRVGFKLLCINTLQEM